MRELFSAEDRKAAAAAIDRDIERRKDASNRLDREQWNSQITSKAAWEKFRDQRIARLRESLGSFPKPANPLPVRVTSSIAGDRFRIDNLLYEATGAVGLGQPLSPIPDSCRQGTAGHGDRHFAPQRQDAERIARYGHDLGLLAVWCW